MFNWEGVNFTHRFSELPSAFFTYVTPQLLDNTRWVVWNGEFAKQFGLPATENDELLNVFSGQVDFAPFAPLAMKYAVSVWCLQSRLGRRSWFAAGRNATSRWHLVRHSPER